MKILWVFEAVNMLGFSEGFIGAYAQTYEEAEKLVNKNYEYPVELKYLYNEIDMQFMHGTEQVIKTVNGRGFFMLA